MVEEREVSDAFPDAESLRPFIGKVVGFDDQGVIRLAADSWEAIGSKLTDELREQLTLFFVPGYSVIG